MIITISFDCRKNIIYEHHISGGGGGFGGSGGNGGGGKYLDFTFITFEGLQSIPFLEI